LRKRLPLSNRLATFLLLAGLLVLAGGIRFYRLTYHSLWFDEIISVFWASQPTARIWEVGMRLVEDRHPPLYYLMLRGWTLILGRSDGAVRSMGAILGALAVLPTYGIGRLLANRRSGAIAALLVALNPFLIWYSQEARMFMPATTMGLTALYGLLAASKYGQDGGSEAQQRGRASSQIAWWVLMVAGLLIAGYSYLLGTLFVAVAGTWLAALLISNLASRESRRRWPHLLAGPVILMLTCALLLPLLWSAWQVSGAEFAAGRPFERMGTALAHQLEAYTIYLGPWSPGVLQAARVGGIVLALLGMAIPLGRRPVAGPRDGAGRVLLGLYLGVPVLLGGLLLARSRVLLDKPHYFIPVVPALCLLWGRGLSALLGRSRLVGTAALACVLLATSAGIAHLWLPENLREDWRTAAEYVESHAGPNDAVLAHVDYTHLSFEHYFDGPQPVFFPFTDHLTDTAQVEPPLLGLLPFDTVWLVQSHTEQFDPQHLVERWLADRFPLATEQYPAGVSVKRFITRYRLTELPVGARNLEAPLGPDVMLVGCQVDDVRTAATDQRSHPPSAWVHVQLYWQPTASPSVDYVTTVRMVDNMGQVWGDSLSRDRDTLRVWPTSRWQLGEIVRQEADVNLNPITPPGQYRIVIGLADAGGNPLTPEVSCGDVVVTE